MLQEHGARHIYKVPEGLRELCSDIAREVYYYVVSYNGGTTRASYIA